MLEHAARLYNAKLICENTMGGSGNKIFEVETPQNAQILRVCEAGDKTRERVELELQWLECLGAKTDSVAKPIRSEGGNLFETICAGEQDYIMCLFEKAQGKIVDKNNPDEFNEKLFFNLGAVMGDMHKATEHFKGNIIKPEFEWDNYEYSWRGKNAILDADVLKGEQKLLQEIRALPKTKDVYGIIHYDIHLDNFFVKNGKIKIFDFYDCQFNWYAADIASAMFFMILRGAGPLENMAEKERTEFAEAYLIAYLKGYSQTNFVREYWINKLDLFVKYQMTDEYRCAQYFWQKELAHLQQWYLDWHKDRITRNLPYATIDYKKVLGSI